MDQIIFFKWSLDGVIPEVNLAHVRKPHQIRQFLFIAVLGHFIGLNNFCHYGQSCRGIRYLSFDAKITPIASVFLEI